MKKITFSVFATLGLISLSQAQTTFTDDFESYTAGDYIGSNSATWTTWSGTTGGTEDVQVTTAQAYSGNNSIYFNATSSSGGPQDVVLPFGGELNTGQFELSSYIYIPSNEGAYFNFQGTSTIGETWAISVQFVDDGNIYLYNDNGDVLTSTFTADTWFKWGFNINLNTNDWEFLINDVSQGVFTNTFNQVASMDIFPVNSSYDGNGSSSFYMDDFDMTYTSYTLPTLNAAVTNVDGMSGLVGLERSPSVTVRNLGTSTITSFDLTVDYNGSQYTENVTGVSITSLDEYTVDFSPFVLATGPLDIVATVSNVNGTTDDDATDDVKTVSLDPSTPAYGKVVVAEEGTGTWCQWCPRGAVMLDNMSENYPGLFVGIAVHNNDPMEYTPYDDGMGFSSFPNSKTDRGSDVDPSYIESEFMDRIMVAPSAVLTNGAEISGNTLKVSVTADFLADISGNYRLACVITEDSVTGIASGYNQYNAYSGGSNGEMGGFELLSNPVPASQMHYNHVARVILPSVAGLSNAFPTTVTTGEIHTVDFYFIIQDEWDLSQLHIVSMFIAPSGDVDNAGSATLTEAQTNGFVESTTEVTGIESNESISQLSLYPNPANDVAYIEFVAEENQSVGVELYDLNGKLVSQKEFTELNGQYQLPIQVSQLEKGIYMVRLTVGDNVSMKKLVVE